MPTVPDAKSRVYLVSGSETLEQIVARVNANGFLPTEKASKDGRSGVMAQKLHLKKGKEFQFKERAVGGELKYPWDEWFDGSLYMLERSEGPENDKGTIEVPTVARDFGVSVNAMVPKIHTAARRRYKVVQISRHDADGEKLNNALIIKARDMTDEERAEEDLLRAEEKEARKAKLAEKVAASRVGSGNGDAQSVEEESAA